MSEAIPISIVSKLSIKRLLLLLKIRKYNEKKEPIKIPSAPKIENKIKLIKIPNLTPLSSSITGGTLITFCFSFLFTFKLN